MPYRAASALALALLAAALPARAQDSLDVLFRFVPDLSTPPTAGVVQAFVPGSFNGWGTPYVTGVDGARIANTHPSKMTYDGASNEYRKTVRLRVGTSYPYKLQIHRDTAPTTNFYWTADPLNPVLAPGPDGNSLVVVADPMVFQLAREQEGGAAIVAVSAAVFGTTPVTALTFEVNGVARDGLAYFNPATRLFRYALPAPVAPGAQFRITATTSKGTVTAEVGAIPPVVTSQPRPAGLRDGITYGPGGTTATLSLFAPHKRYAYVVGDFNDWTRDARYLMKRDSLKADSVWYWLELTGLTPGQEVGFQYDVDGLIRVADPYAEKVLMPGDDASISAATYPNLKPYPAGTTGPVGVLQPGRTPFAWQTTGYTRPRPRDLVVYELILRDFLARHDFATLRDTLGYLQKLGVNAIELMPVSEFDGNLSWGYNPAFHFAVDKYYGPADDLKRLVDEAHRRGMAVVLDVVYNHATGQSPLVRLWNTSATGDPSGVPTAQNPYANPTATHPFSVFNDLNHESAATKYWLDRVNRFWVEEYRIDGYRFDLSGGFMQSGPFIGYNPGRIALLKRMMGALWTAHPDTYVILEHLIENGQEWRELAAYGKDRGWNGPLLWHNMNRPYSQSAMGYPTATDFPSALTETHPPAWAGGLPVANAVTYMESHDEQWMMYRNRNYGNTTAGYSVRDLATALDRQKLAGAFFFTVPGPRMVWEFGELGYGGGAGECLVEGTYPGECPAGTPGRVDAKPIRWEYRADPNRLRLLKTWAFLGTLRRDHPVFRSDSTSLAGSALGLTPLRRLRLAHPTMNVVVVGNFGVTPGSISPDFHAAGTWYDVFGGAPVTVADPSAPVTLRPGEFRLYTDRFVGYAEAGIGLGAERVAGAAAPAVLTLDGARPNPAAGRTTFAYGVPAAGPVRLDVFDVLGRRVATVVDAVQTPGRYTAAFDADGLAGGLYVARLSAGGAAVTTPFTLAR